MFEISGNNFNDWFRKLKMVLRVERKLFVIEQPISLASPTDSEYLRSGMRYIIHNKELKSMFEKQAGVEWFNLIQTFHACKQDEGKPVGPYHNMGKTVGELHAMLIEYEKGLPKKAVTPQLMMIKGGKIHKSNKKSLKAKGKGKANGKGKDKQVYIPKPKNPNPSAKEHPTKDDTCHHCKEVGHCKRNCTAYLAELIKKKKQVGTASSSDFFIIELFSFSTKSRVYDTSYGTHICNTKHGLRGVRKLKQVEAIGSFDLVLPNVLVICLDNCRYAPSITRGVVSVHHLVENGFVQCFTDFGISVSKNNVHYLITKRSKYNLDSTYLWHYCLAHISKKYIEKLQQKGLLKSTDDESFDQCVSCLSGKMTRKSFPHRPERATDLLGIIHTNVYGPLRHVSRQGASYFITFTDDYSRYGYVYLLKHKHEVFETFKVFKIEVENQLGKTIKALRSDRESTTRILNMVLTKKVDKTLYELWYGKVPNLSYLKETMGYYFYFPPENKIVVARYAEFFEKNLITQEVSRRAIDLEEIQDEDTSPSKITSEIPMEVEGFKPPQKEVIPVHRSERTHRAPARLCLNVEAKEHSLGDLNEPTSYKAAMLDSESNKWIDAMNAEIQSMMDNMVWVLVDLPPGCKTVRSKWIFKKKTDMDGIVHTYKARLVAKGYTQLYGVDYEETFSPVADIRAIRILISIAAFYDYEIWQMDVKTAFLNGYLDEDIYMVQPEGFVDPNHPRKVCKLQRSIYGLKQASRSWNKRFDEEIKRFGFSQNLDEPCVYQKASRSNCFAMKDLGEAAFILGIKIYRDRSKRLIGLSQSAYMDKILKRYRMDNSKRGHIPMQERLDLNKTQGASTPEEVKRMQNVPYASAVGSIMYAVRCTRPDVAFAQNITSRFQQNPGEPHWTAVKTILKYLRNTKDMFLVYGGNPEAKLRVECYCDAGFETDRDDTKSQTGYVFILNGGAVDWKSSKQSTTAMSATEAEYIAASEAAMEAVWIRKFISGLGIVPTINEPIKMFCDNSAALHFANEPGVQRGARHYHRRYHYVRESVALGEIKFLKVHTDDNLADPFTKALPNGKLTQHARSMGLRLASSFM
ncbi:retrotransposon protein, putative, ty1-copia subclass [Tanacetum coccineum]|uniref:Retrotransposon protein, putative, ty1-copia subclass n=1 Tax=Tanacetum coccineum TaxID=301880 RepID=A0ABQ5EKU6_9ASTR